MRPSLFVAAFATVMTTPIALADTSCDAIGKAMLAMNDKPGVKQISLIKDGSQETRMEAILLADAMYIHDGSNWQRMPMTAKQRKDMAQAALKQVPLTDCTGPKAETVNGTAMNIYEYKQNNPMKPGTKISGKLWIGASDGLMYRMESDMITQTMEYGTFKPPM